MPRLFSPVNSLDQIINMIARVIEANVMTVGNNACGNFLLFMQTPTTTAAVATARIANFVFLSCKDSILVILCIDKIILEKK